MVADTFQVRGLKSVSNGLLRLAAAVPRAAAVAINEVAEFTMTDAKEHTPVKYGVLRDSGKVMPRATANKLAARLSFGTEYAVYVHEMTHLRHRVGEAKFLENAVSRASRTFEKDVARSIREQIGGRP